jgi:hypothetical protein
MTTRLKARPIITHEQALKAAGPAVGIKPVKTAITYLYRGVNYDTKIIVTSYGIRCPNCDEVRLDLYPHPAGRGPICSVCLRRCEVVESEG